MWEVMWLGDGVKEREGPMMVSGLQPNLEPGRRSGEGQETRGLRSKPLEKVRLKQCLGPGSGKVLMEWDCVLALAAHSHLLSM